MDLSHSGVLTTVTGVISSQDMGMTLPHEHLLNDMTASLDAPSYEFSKFLVELEVKPDLRWALRHDPYCSKDNISTKQANVVRAEAAAFGALGGRTIVDATGSPRMGRDPQGLVRLANDTGLNVVMSSGPYLEKFEKERISARSVDEQTTEIVGELSEGVGEEKIRAGVIGEIGVSPAFTSAEREALRAAALAQIQCPSIALNIHMPGWERRGDEILDLVLDEVGVDPAKVSLAHSDPSGQDRQYQRGLLERGVWLEFDMIGMDISFPNEGKAPSIHRTVEAVAGLIDDGHGDRILLSHDLFLKQMWCQNGGNGWVIVPTVFTEQLIAAGVHESTAYGLVTGNPRRLLT